MLPTACDRAALPMALPCLAVTFPCIHSYLRTASQGTVLGSLAAKAVGTQGQGGVLAAKAVGTRGKGSVLAAKAVEPHGKGSVLPLPDLRPE